MTAMVLVRQRLALGGDDNGAAVMLVHVVRIDNCFNFEGAGKSTVLNSLIGHPVLPTGENGATQAPISIDL
ncbi:hypothetical protein FEM48_Zijuj01G0249900 [Ziziphus jujuba var. spinosa]|uniref:Dynamin N-terminal domain-containing protein n=1 Tax=Ziziphus jujuba var. spinosa TaxID=714518 RepID=A0A978W4L7_ZIZJJ|nr:hypothetical protein FEM48_Zijuj01G0249900 [Ziziphus jujuba var. spinosa]